MMNERKKRKNCMLVIGEGEEKRGKSIVLVDKRLREEIEILFQSTIKLL